MKSNKLFIIVIGSLLTYLLIAKPLYELGKAHGKHISLKQSK